MHAHALASTLYPPCNLPPPRGRHFDISFWKCQVVLCSSVLSLQVPSVRVDSPVIQTQMYATGTRVWHHSRSKGGPLLATVISPSSSGSEFLHIDTRVLGTRLWTIQQPRSVGCRLYGIRFPGRRNLMTVHLKAHYPDPLTTILLRNQHLILILILILILMMTLMVMHCQCPLPPIATHSRRMEMTSLRWRWYGRRLPVGFGDRVMCLMEICTLHVTFATMTRYLNN